jgi:cyclic pyranopterin phosphate synthase
LNGVLKGIEKALEIGFNPVKINVVAFRGYNDDEVEAFGKLALEKPLQIRFIEHMPVNSSSTSATFVCEKEILEKLARVDKLEEIPNENCSEPARKFRFLRGVGEIGVISPISNKFCSSCNRLRLNPDGKLQGCLLEGGFTDIKHHLRNGATDAG